MMHAANNNANHLIRYIFTFIIIISRLKLLQNGIHYVNEQEYIVYRYIILRKLYIVNNGDTRIRCISLFV